MSRARMGIAAAFLAATASLAGPHISACQAGDIAYEERSVHVDVRCEWRAGGTASTASHLVPLGEEVTLTLGGSDEALHLMYRMDDAPEGFVRVRIRCSSAQTGRTWSFSSESYARYGEPALFSVNEDKGLRLTVTAAERVPTVARDPVPRPAPMRPDVAGLSPFRWGDNWEAARGEALRTGRPLLVYIYDS